MSYQFIAQDNISLPDTDAIGIIRIVDNAHIPNSSDNIDWQEYLEWLNEGNTPLSSRTVEKQLEDRRLQVLVFVNSEAEILRLLLEASENRLSLRDKDGEAVLHHNGDVTDPQTQVPYAWQHSKVRQGLGDPRTQGIIAIEILQDWHTAFRYYEQGTIRIDAIREQCERLLNNKTLVDTLTRVEDINAYAVIEFEEVRTYLLEFVP